MRDLTEIYADVFTAPINGKTYTVPAPSAKQGLLLRHELATDATKVNNMEWINLLFKGDPLPEEGGAPSGGLWDELDEDGVSSDHALHFGVTAIAWYGYGPEVAEIYWESLGKPLPEEAATKETDS